jgi:hypothetical protein
MARSGLNVPVGAFHTQLDPRWGRRNSWSNFGRMALAKTARLPLAALVGVAIAATSAAVARADGPAAGSPAPSSSRVRVATDGCIALRPERVEQLLQLELATLVPVVAALPELAVDLSCSGSDVRITLRDAITVKVVSRDVSLGIAADPERALALAASELFLASWAELLIQPPAGRTVATDPALSAAKSAVERAIPALRKAPALSVDVLAIGRERHISAPLPTLGVALRGGQATGTQHQLFAQADWEWGSARRPFGHVDVAAGALSLGARWSVRFAEAEIGLSGSVSAVYVRIEGVSSSPDFFGATSSGLTAQATGAADANVTLLRTVRLGVAVLVGALAPGPVGLVSGDSPVRLDGAWVGATCFAGLFL